MSAESFNTKSYVSVFSERVKLLRKVYNLTTGDFQEFIFFKTRSSVAGLESGRSLPSYEVLLRISLFFAVRLEWLTGFSDVPYSQEANFMANDALENRLKFLDQQRAGSEHIVSNVIQLSQAYAKADDDSKYGQSDIVASNIIYLLNSTYLHELECTIRKQGAVFSAPNLEDYLKIKTMSNTSDVKHTPQSRMLERTKNLFLLLSMEKTEPFYDLRTPEVKLRTPELDVIKYEDDE